jgi:putative two-component system response regulator
MTAQRILVVDDDPGVGSLLVHGLSAEGFEVTLSYDGAEGLARARRDRPDLILLDVDLPGMHGDEVCRRLKNDPSTQLIPIVLITGGSFGGKVAAWRDGADEFLTKPFHFVEVVARCRSLLRIKRLIEERDSAESVVFALARAVEAKSPYTHGHSERVRDYCLMLAEVLGLGGHERSMLAKGALLHDVGKISIPDDILNKPGRLTPAEMDAIREHPVTGAHIVEPLLSVREVIPLIRWHHERMDGKGYPDGKRAGELSPLVRILSVCDVYDSLSSDRPYRDGMPPRRCIEILREEAGRGLDGELVEAFAPLVFTDFEEAPTPRESERLVLLPQDGA